MTPQFERFFSRILIKHIQGATICYLYNREALNTFVSIKQQEWDKSQFIEIGDILDINGTPYKVVKINFKLEDHLNEMEHGYGINLYSPTDPTDFNCQIGVFVENID